VGYLLLDMHRTLYDPPLLFQTVSEEEFSEVELPPYGVLRSSPLARLSGIMLATVRDELRSRVGQQGGWRHDEDGVNNGLDSAGPGILRHPPDPVGKPQTQVSSAIHSEFIAMCSHFAE
jgi:hypothetical protein